MFNSNIFSQIKTEIELMPQSELECLVHTKQKFIETISPSINQIKKLLKKNEKRIKLNPE